MKCLYEYFVNVLLTIIQANAELQGIRDAGGDATVFQYGETPFLSIDVY